MQSKVCPLLIVKQSFLYHYLDILVSCHMKNEKEVWFYLSGFPCNIIQPVQLWSTDKFL